MQVSTLSELKSAIDRRECEIAVVGELAAKMIKIRSLFGSSIPVLMLLLGATATAPFTFGTSYAAAAAFTGVEISLIILAVSIGITLIIAVVKHYDVHMEGKNCSGDSAKVILRRKF
jgi:hypothetical protein